MDCVFCKILSGQLSSYIVFQNSQVAAFLDIHPQSPGHVLVVPKTHWQTILELDQTQLGELWVGVQEVLKIISHQLQPDGFSIRIAQGEVAGQEVPHLHVHLIPRYQDIPANLTQVNLEQISQRLKNQN